MSLIPPSGTPITVEVKGIGWRPLESSWMLLYDNHFTGWISAVTTAGSATFTIPATGGPGVHVHGEEQQPQNFKIPQLTYATDHPGEDLPRFRFAFEVTEE
ncbi:MAG: hypothetical protein JO139_16285 [Alphaproteobacteria bacterium]|nr:hypothetical protein [Alphaproteobacteria bacterium]MBV8334673.1 hypothetical protein [Alphaproteobacteria bacterium]